MKVVSSSSVLITFLGFSEAAAVSTFAVISKAREGFFNTFLAHFLPTLTGPLRRFLKISPGPSACRVLSLTIIDFFPLQSEHCPTNNLISPPVLLLYGISPKMFFVME